MFVISRALTRQVLNKQRFYRQLFVPSNQQQTHDEYARESYKWNKLKIIAGTGLFLVGYDLMKNYLTLPKVHAATAASESPRAKVRIHFF